MAAGIQDDADVSDALLLVFIGKQRLRMASRDTPVDGMLRVAGLVFADAEKVDPGTALTSRDQARINAGDARADGNPADTRGHRQDQNLPTGGQALPDSQQPEQVAGQGLQAAKLIKPAPACKSVLP